MSTNETKPTDPADRIATLERRVAELEAMLDPNIAVDPVKLLAIGGELSPGVKLQFLWNTSKVAADFNSQVRAKEREKYSTWRLAPRHLWSEEEIHQFEDEQKREEEINRTNRENAAFNAELRREARLARV